MALPHDFKNPAAQRCQTRVARRANRLRVGECSFDAVVVVMPRPGKGTGEAIWISAGISHQGSLHDWPFALYAGVRIAHG